MYNLPSSCEWVLTDRTHALLQLKAEQTRADRTRDAAWAELKRCVEEVARLSTQVRTPRMRACRVT